VPELDLSRVDAEDGVQPPGAAGSLREGMEETLTVIRLGSAASSAARSIGLRWTAAGMLEAEKQFRKVIGYTALPRLAIAIAIERRLHLPSPTRHEPRHRSQSPCNDHNRTAATKVPRRPGQPRLVSQPEPGPARGFAQTTRGRPRSRTIAFVVRRSCGGRVRWRRHWDRPPQPVRPRRPLGIAHTGPPLSIRRSMPNRDAQSSGQSFLERPRAHR
jgi:hypothetical protein